MPLTVPETGATISATMAETSIFWLGGTLYLSTRGSTGNDCSNKESISSDKCQTAYCSVSGLEDWKMRGAPAWQAAVLKTVSAYRSVGVTAFAGRAPDIPLGARLTRMQAEAGKWLI